MVDGPSQRGDDDTAKAQDRRRLVWRLAVVAAGVLLLLVLVVVVLPPRFTAHRTFDKDYEELKAQNDVRATLLQGLAAVLVLTGAGIGAAVTLRQIRISQGQLQATREQMQHTLETTHQQLNLTEQGQVTDRYTRAVEQLGHEKAPVRLGALYSLEHLAQDNPQYRQTVVDVVCAYLRMPHTPPAQPKLDAEQVEELAPPANGRDRPSHSAPGRDPGREELQVRQTAQRLLADHLRCPPRTSGQDAQLLPPSPQQAFWPGISLDLTGAALVDLDFKAVSAGSARFSRATFHGFVRFHGATFRDDADFDEATFRGGAWFNGATFQRAAWFNGATFRGDAWFSQATFWRAGFSRATFQGAAWFPGATFQDSARFYEATFQCDARLSGAIFQGAVEFHGATFQGDAWFNDATFQGDNRGEGVAGAQVLRLDDSDLNQRRVWPDGCTVRPDPTDPTRGTLVRAEDAKEPEPAVPPSDPADNASGTG